jgi:hypothetical protein
LLAGVLDALDPCAPASLRDKMSAARKAFTGHGRPPSFSDAAESNTALAGQLWAAGVRACGTLLPEDAALSRVIARLAAR